MSETATPAPALVNPDAVREAVAEVADNADEYVDLIKVLRNPEARKNLPLVLKEATEALQEGVKDYRAVAPAAQNVTQALRSGTGTSEFRAMSFVSKVLTVVALVAPGLEAALYALQDTAIFNGNSVWVTMVATILKALLAGNYATGRTRIKTAAMETGYVAVDGNGSIVGGHR